MTFRDKHRQLGNKIKVNTLLVENNWDGVSRIEIVGKDNQKNTELILTNDYTVQNQERQKCWETRFLNNIMTVHYTEDGRDVDELIERKTLHPSDGGMLEWNTMNISTNQLSECLPIQQVTGGGGGIQIRRENTDRFINLGQKIFDTRHLDEIPTIHPMIFRIGGEGTPEKMGFNPDDFSNFPEVIVNAGGVNRAINYEQMVCLLWEYVLYVTTPSSPPEQNLVQKEKEIILEPEKPFIPEKQTKKK